MNEQAFTTQATVKADLWLGRRDESGRQLSLFTLEGSVMKKALTAIGLSLSINFALLGLFAAAFGSFATTQHGQVTVSEVESTYAYAPVASASPSVHQF
jgi:hypothetical protein